MKAKDIIKLNNMTLIGEPLRICNSCGFEAMNEEDLELMVTVGASRSAFGRKNKCKECKTKEYRVWYEDNRRRLKEKAKASQVKKRYGISIEEYNKHMSTSVVCEICGTDKKLRYDHNHDSGEFRGVLCTQCNSGLGLLKDSPERLAKAIVYLTERGHYGES